MKKILLVSMSVLALGAITYCGSLYFIHSQHSASNQPNERDPRDVPYVTTPHTVVDKMLELCDISEDDLMLDLGCGDGRLVIAAAKKYGCRAKGYDIDPELIELCKKNAKESGVDHLVEFHVQNIFDLDISDADVITIFLMPHLNLRLLPQLQTMKPGCRIVSHQFDLPGVPEEQKLVIPVADETGYEHRHLVYFWKTPMLLERDFVPEARTEVDRELQKIKDTVKYRD